MDTHTPDDEPQPDNPIDRRTIAELTRLVEHLERKCGVIAQHPLAESKEDC